MTTSKLIGRMVDRYMAHEASGSTVVPIHGPAMREVIIGAIMDAYGVDEDDAGDRLYAMIRMRQITQGV